MRIRSRQEKRKGSVLVEYALLIAGVALTCVLAISVLGHKAQYPLMIMADILPAAEKEDNKPVGEVKTMPLNNGGAAITLDSGNLVSQDGTDRMKDVLGPNGGSSLIVENP